MNGFEDYYPDQLSGGMNQRVTIARAISIKPDMLLMDEPLASIDFLTDDKSDSKSGVYKIMERRRRILSYIDKEGVGRRDTCHGC